MRIGQQTENLPIIFPGGRIESPPMIPKSRLPVLVLIPALFAGPAPSTLMGGRMVVPVEEEEKSGAESGTPRVAAPDRDQSRRRSGRTRGYLAACGLCTLAPPTAAGIRAWSLRTGPSPGRAVELAQRFGCGAFLLI